MATKIGPITIKSATESSKDLGFDVKRPKLGIGVNMPKSPVEIRSAGEAINKAASSLFGGKKK